MRKIRKVEFISNLRAIKHIFIDGIFELVQKM